MSGSDQRRDRLGGRAWAVVIVVGLVGQLAWTIENMYLNVFIYNTITTNPHVLATTVAVSAAAATLATLLLGAASDKVGARRPFIAVGYVLWGASTALFGFVQPGNTTAAAISAAVIAIIALDALMSFLGAGANDAAFNAWVTEATVPQNRGRVEGVIAIMPLLAMLIVFGALDGLTQGGQWRLFFGIIGSVTAGVGLLAWFLVRDAPAVQRSTDGYLSAVIRGMRPSSMRSNPRLYVLLGTWAIMGTATQVFMPYLIIYIQRYLRIDAYALVLASVLISASAVSVVGGRVIDRVGKQNALAPSVLVMIVGLVGMFFARGVLAVILVGAVMMSGFMLSAATLGASVRDATPTDRVGMVQGLRMIAMVLIPMVIGPFIGSWVIVGANETYTDLGVVKQVPTPWIFLAGAAVALLTLAPIAYLNRMPRTPRPAQCRRGAQRDA